MFWQMFVKKWQIFVTRFCEKCSILKVKKELRSRRLNKSLINEISVSLMSVMVLKKPKNVNQVEVLVKRSSMVILWKVLLQSSLECYGLHYGAGKSFKNYKMLMKKIGGLCKARLKLDNLFFLFMFGSKS